MEKGDRMKDKIKEYCKTYHIETMMSKAMLSHMELHHFKKGDVVMHTGKKLDYIMFIVSGKAKTLYLTHNGTNTLHSFLSPFSMIGDVEFFYDHPIINDVIALCDMDCLCISTTHRKEIQKDERFIYTMASQLSIKLINSNHNKSVSLNYPVENRLAAYICATSVQDCFQQNLQDGAEMIGCSYRQLQRVLQMFVKEGYMVKVKKGTYRVMDWNYLQTLGKDIYVF